MTLVKQSFTYNNEKLVTIYHIGLESPHTDPELATENSLSLSEETFDDRDIDSQNTLIIEGFLPLFHPKNPYSTYCCNYREEIHGTYEEKMHLFNSAQFNGISQFVKKWSGLDLQRTPLSLFNTLILRPTEYVVTMRLDKSENLLVEINSPRRSKLTQMESLKLIVKSAIHGMNTGYIEYCLPRNTSELEREFCVALPKPLLGGIDVELIEGNSLVYASYDTHFIRAIKINLDLIKEIGRYSTDYKKINKREMPIIETSNGSQVIVGNKDQSVISTYLYMEDQLSISKQGSLFKFLTRNSSEEFFKFLEGLLKANSQSEIWFFDPFLLEYGCERKERFVDTMRTILFSVTNQKKHFVFNCSDSYIGNENKYLSQRLKSIKEDMKKRKIKDVAAEFVCVDISFHDRFAFVTKNSRPTKGFLLGTSLNSMGENYSSIVELSQKDAEYTFSVLVNEIYTGSRRLAEAKL